MKPISIVVVEQNHFIRTSLIQTFSCAESFELIGSYDNIMEALDTVLSRVPDIVLLGIDFDLQGALRFLQKNQESSNPTKVLIITSQVNEETFLNMLALGVHGYMLKAGKNEELLSAITYACSGGIPISRDIAEEIFVGLRKGQKITNSKLQLLSKRENEILQELFKGKLYKEIAQILGISDETVRKHVHHIYAKLGVNNRIEAYNVCFGEPKLQTENLIVDQEKI